MSLYGKTPVCVACVKPLTPEEQHYYEFRCEGCEAQWLARLEAWRGGKPDAELDSQFMNNGSMS